MHVRTALWCRSCFKILFQQIQPILSRIGLPTPIRAEVQFPPTAHHVAGLSLSTRALIAIKTVSDANPEVKARATEVARDAGSTR